MLKGKNFLVEEKIIFFKCRLPLRGKINMTELLPMTVYPFTLMWMSTLSWETTLPSGGHCEKVYSLIQLEAIIQESLQEVTFVLFVVEISRITSRYIHTPLSQLQQFFNQELEWYIMIQQKGLKFYQIFYFLAKTYTGIFQEYINCTKFYPNFTQNFVRQLYQF